MPRALPAQGCDGQGAEHRGRGGSGSQGSAEAALGTGNWVQWVLLPAGKQRGKIHPCAWELQHSLHSCACHGWSHVLSPPWPLGPWAGVPRPAAKQEKCREQP